MLQLPSYTHAATTIYHIDKPNFEDQNQDSVERGWFMYGLRLHQTLFLLVKKNYFVMNMAITNFVNENEKICN